MGGGALRANFERRDKSRMASIQAERYQRDRYRPRLRHVKMGQRL